MLPNSLWLLCLAAISTRAQTTSSIPSSSSASSSSTTSSTISISSISRGTSSVDIGSDTRSFSTLTEIPTSVFNGPQFTYLSNTDQSTVNTTASSNATSSSNSQITRTTASEDITLIGGGATSTSNATLTSYSSSSSTSSSPTATNTVPCNNYPEFCNRKYSNISEICAHNSAFAIKNNAGSNQIYGVLDQLNDGIRMIQGETQYINDTIYQCHTSCDLLNAGPWQSTLETIVTWLQDNPYDVVTILIGNSYFQKGVTVKDYVPAIQNSGIAQYLYEPEYIPQHRDQWPTLGQMILSGKRVVMFMDYNANQTAVPYVLDQYSHLLQTPFSPTNRSFPCTIERPDGVNDTEVKDNYMYLANHNLNLAIDIQSILGNGVSSGDDVILVPNTALLNVTNSANDEFGSLETMRETCTADWNQPPNFFVVDYYNVGSPFPGSVFEVAARANGVTYNRPCCGMGRSAATSVTLPRVLLLLAGVIAGIWAWW